jgi:polysaccharide deacetylase 2 family uncharacterized protein YibQ
MPVDDLNRPLGLDRESARRREIPWNRIGVAGLAALAAGLAIFVWITDDGMGGEPYAIARIERSAAPAAARPPSGQGAHAALPHRASGAAVEAQSGVEVVRAGGGGAPGALVIEVPHELGIQLAPAPDPRLVERSRYGSLPRIGPDGSKPMDVYARPVMTSSNLSAGAPRIALVVGGMGLNRAATQSAIERLPGETTLAFAPYGPDLAGQVAAARAGGHETILQLPMESFGAEGEPPGPHMLKADAPADQMIDNARWLMSRFTGYVGVANFLGARFTASEHALAPLMREIGARGLLWFDDGGSPRTLAPALAQRLGAPFAMADVAIDADPAPAAIDAALARLESVARQKRVAIGFASGLPAGVDLVARFARTLSGRGVALVPLSAAAAAPRGVEARNAP